MVRKLNDAMAKFKTTYTYENRVDRCKVLKEKYPDRVPIILMPFYADDPACTRSKFLIKNSDRMSVLTSQLHKHLSAVPQQSTPLSYLGSITSTVSTQPTVSPHQAALYFLCNNRMVHMNQTFDELYSKYASDDGFLYIYYCTENVFGK